MKISDVQAIPLAIPPRPMTPPSPWQSRVSKQIVVRILTDEGLSGVGEAFALGAPLAVCNVIVEGLAPLLRGQDPTRIEYLVDLLHRSTMIYGRRGIGMFAISGVEIALWDLLGKARNAPLYELLGGIASPRLPVYASLLRYDSPEDVASAARDYADRGFRSIKLHQTDVASVRAAREAVGPEVELMLDANCPWTPAEAIAMVRALEPYRLSWLEEPVWPPEDYEGLAQVQRESPIPIAAGENESTVFGFREMILRPAVDIVQPSVTKVGGIAEFQKIAKLADVAHLDVAPHSPYFGAGLAATLHLMASLRQRLPVELFACELETSLLSPPIVAKDGWFDVPTGPGLGVEVDEAVIRRYPYPAEGERPFVLT